MRGVSLAPDLHDVTLDTLAYGGDALGRLEDGRPVFVPFALPGERVRVRLVKEARGHARGKVIEAGYELSQVTPFDLFPQTHNIESISLIEK